MTRVFLDRLTVISKMEVTICGWPLVYPVWEDHPASCIVLEETARGTQSVSQYRNVYV